jgi:hypothetical protein
MTTFNQQLADYVANNPRLVIVKDIGNGLQLLKYHRRVFYDNLWNRYLEECRGTIVDSEYNPVTYPFKKIFNYGIENRAPRIAGTAPVVAYRKVNGFMAALTWYQDDILVSTTGSINSIYVERAREMMLLHGDWAHWCSTVGRLQGHTLLFEVVHPDDPHIIPETAGMYFLGYRRNDWGSTLDGYGGGSEWQQIGAELGCHPVQQWMTTLRELVDSVAHCKHEGWVFYTADGVSSKLKSPYYLINKWLARNPDVGRIMQPGYKQSVDEEYHGLVDHVRANIDQYAALDEQQRLAWIRQYFLTQTAGDDIVSA